MADAELGCLAAAQVLLSARSEHHRPRMCHGRLGHLSPYLHNWTIRTTDLCSMIAYDH